MSFSTRKLKYLSSVKDYANCMKQLKLYSLQNELQIFVLSMSKANQNQSSYLFL